MGGASPQGLQMVACSETMRPFTLEEVNSWWEGEGTLALLPKGCHPATDCKKAQFAITQLTVMEFHEEMRDALVRLCDIAKEACFVCPDRTTLRNPIGIKKILDILEPLVRTPKKIAQIQAFRELFEARKALFRPYGQKPRLRKHTQGRIMGP